MHAENDMAISRAPSAHGESYAAFLRSRPPGAENVAGLSESAARIAVDERPADSADRLPARLREQLVSGTGS